MRNADEPDEGDGGGSFEDFAARFPSKTRDRLLGRLTEEERAEKAAKAARAEAAAKAEAERAEAERDALARAVARHLAADRPGKPAADGMLTTAQVAARLGVKKVDGVLALIRKGDLVASNVSQGKKRAIWRVAEADLAAFLEKKRATPPAPTVRRRKRKAETPRTEYFAER
jgi:hypothetical protein